jgi:hypothetical protein
VVEAWGEEQRGRGGTEGRNEVREVRQEEGGETMDEERVRHINGGKSKERKSEKVTGDHNQPLPSSSRTCPATCGSSESG